MLTVSARGLAVAAAVAATLMTKYAAAGTATIAVTGTPSPDGNGQLHFMAVPQFNNAGQLAFFASLQNTSGGMIDDTGTYFYNGTSLQLRLRENTLAPEGNGRFVDPGTGPMNSAGQYAFSGTLRNTTGGTNDDTGIYFHNGTTVLNRARENAGVPEGNGLFSTFVTSPVLNSVGNVAFHADLKSTSLGTADNSGLYYHDGAILINVARENFAAPGAGGGFYSEFTQPTLSSTNVIAFQAQLKNTPLGATEDNAIFINFPGFVTQRIVRENDNIPDGPGKFDWFAYNTATRVPVNDAGQVAFGATLRNTAAPGLDDQGIYLYDNGPVSNRVRSNALVPEGNGRFANLGVPQLNSSGQIAFNATLRNTANGTSDDTGIYLHNGVSIVNVARENLAVPDGSGQFQSFSDPVLNNSGQVAFWASLKNTGGAGNSGIYLSDGIDQVKVARVGDLLAGKIADDVSIDIGHGTQDGRGTSVNDFGQVAYQAIFDLATTPTMGLFVFTPELRWRATGSSGLWNNYGNWTLGLRPQQVHDVTINPSANATILGPTNPVTVKSLTIGGNNGSATATLQLQPGGTISTTTGTAVVVAATGVLTGNGTLSNHITNHGTILTDNLQINGQIVNHGLLTGTGTLNATLPILNAASGTLTGKGTINANITNSGTVLADNLSINATLTNNALVTSAGTGVGRVNVTNLINGATGSLTGNLIIGGNINNNGTITSDQLTVTGTLTNNGVVDSTGTINGTLTNNAAGQVRVDPGDELRFLGASNTSAGRMEVLQGALEFTQGLTNSGTITGREMLLHFSGSGLANTGNLQISFGTSDVFGTIANNSGGKVVLSGASNTTFYNNLTNAGGATLQVSTGSTAVFFGHVTNNGAVTGGGTKFFEGGSTGVLGALQTSGSTVVEYDATVAAASIRESSLTVNGVVNINPDGTAAGTSTFNTLSIADGARLELNDNDIIVDYAAGDPSPEFTIRDWVLAGLASGTGITTLATPDEDTVLAVAEQFEWAETTFNGFAIDDTTVVGKYTYFGDANLDGQVTTDDYVAVDLGLGTGDSWVQGDFDLNGVVTTDDYVVVDLNLGKGTSNPLAYAEEQARMIALHTEMFGPSYVNKLAYASEHGWVAASVPEPAGIGALGAICALLFRRCRPLNPRNHRAFDPRRRYRSPSV